MATRSIDDRNYETVGIDTADLQRYAGFTLEPGVVSIFELENANAWLQSSRAIKLDCIR